MASVCNVINDLGTWTNYVENMKKYVGNMEKYVGSELSEYEHIMNFNKPRVWKMFQVL